MNRRFKHIVLLTAACWLLGLSVNAQTSNVPTINGRVFGGGNKAAVYGAVTVDITAGEVKQSVFGGGNEEGIHTNTITGNVGTATLTIDGGTICSDGGDYGVYGGCNTSGTVEGVVTVNINGGTFGSDEDNRIKGIFGGGYGEPTKTASSVEVTIGNSTTTPTIYGDVYGGSAFGDVNSATGALNNDAHTYVTLKKGSITGNVYGGGLGQQEEGTSGDPNYKPAILAKVWSPVTVTVEGGTLNTHTNNTLGGKVFGCNNQNGAPQSTVTVNIEKSTAQNAPALSITNVYGGGNLAAYTYSGEGNYPQVNIKNGTVANVFGGGKGADSGDGSIGAVSGNPQVTVQGGTVSEGTYGGGQKANTTGDPSVSITSGSSANLYGGGMAANVTGAPTVTVSGGAVTTGVYGGCNASGNVSGNITVDIIGGTIGSQENLNQNTPVLANVFGGGYGVSTSTSGNVTVNISRATGDNPPAAPTIYGDVYGGSALGSVNAANANPINTTTVNILDGTLVTKEGTDANGFAVYNGGNVFGGGLGESGPANVSKGQVNGTVTVNIGAYEHTGASGGDHTGNIYSGLATIGGSVYGCNNTNGSPQQDVTVNVYQTAHTNGSNNTPNNTFEGTAFAIANVFGGGNLANYAPAASGKKATVNIFSCENTIGRTFGGGNAAEAPEVVTDIKGGRIGQVFGGGNGEVSAANINGAVTIGIHGGTVGQFFGGSNTSGNISGEITIDIDNDGCGSPNINEFFCGGNFADIIGGLSSDITCAAGMTVQGLYGGCNMADVWGDVVLNLYGGIYDYVFGGSKGDVKTLNTTEDPNHINKAANIRKFPTQEEISTAPSGTYPQEVISYLSDAYNNGQNLYGTGGNVTLNLYGGTIKDNAFGGSNVNGNIDGVITVNVLDYEASTCPLTVKNIYGGCNLTPYTPKDATTVSPVVNVMHIKEDKTITGNVFGGSKGGVVIDSTCLATVTANPQVNIGYDANTMPLPAGYNVVSSADFQAKVTGNVFGGGDLAPVAGSTEVTLQHDNSSAASLFGGGNKADVGGATVNVLNGSVNTSVYGGCNEEGTVNGDIAVNIMSGLTLAEGIYGGGKGGDPNPDNNTPEGTFTTGNVTVTIGDANHTPTLYSDVYGGSAFGQVGASDKTTTVELVSGTINGTLYGGGKGQVKDTQNNIDAYVAEVSGNTEVDVNGSVTGGVYGGCNYNGVVKKDITVNVTAGTIGASSSRANIHGGGYGAATATEGAVTVNIATDNATAGPTIYGDLYGGSAFGQVSASGKMTQVNFYKGTINGDVYGGGLGGDGNPAEVSGNVMVNIKGGVFNKADGTLGGGQIFGCNNANGTPKGTVAVNIYATDHGDGVANNECPAVGTITNADELAANAAIQTYAIAAVYGGGNLASYEPVANQKTTVYVHNCANTIKDVYGGGNAADVGILDSDPNTPDNQTISADTYIIIDGGRIHRVFGGGNGADAEANIYGTATTTIKAGLIDQVFGGGNISGSITSTSLSLSKEGTCTDEVFGEVFGGANLAPIVGSLNTTINCGVGTIGTIYGGSNLANIGTEGSTNASVTLNIKGGTYDYVYGGSKGDSQNLNTTNDPDHINKPAHIYGGVTLNLNGGKITNAFGGSNIYGNIAGQITVNVENTQSDPCALDLTNVYGGCNLASYKPTNADLASPAVNVYHGTVKGNVFGGSHGDTADTTVVQAKPTVVVGDLREGQDSHKATVNGNVYGGGDLARVTGGTSVTIQKGGETYGTSVLQDVFAGGNRANVSGSTSVSVTGGTITQDVYGGGALANVGTNTDNEATITLSGGAVRTLYGGGMGRLQDGDDEAIAALVNGNAVVTISGGTISGHKIGEDNGNDVNGAVFGGCNVNGTVMGGTTVGITSGTVGANNNTAHANVYGGGLGAATNVQGSVEVTISKATGENPPATPIIYGDVYGGSAKGLVNYTYVASGTPNTPSQSGTTSVTLSDGAVYGDIYGGGHGLKEGESYAEANVGRPVTVTVSGGSVNTCAIPNSTETFGGNVYGCNNLKGAPKNTVTVNIEKSTAQNAPALSITNNVYGGGNMAAYGGTPDVNIIAGTVSGAVFGGGNEAGVGGGDVVMTGGNVLQGLYGGCNTSGTVDGSISVNVDGGQVGTDENNRAYGVFGGGYGEATGTSDGITVVIGNDENRTPIIYGDVYGGSAEGNVNDDVNEITKVWLKRGSVVGDIYGGGFGDNNKEALVNGKVQVIVDGGSVSSVGTSGGRVFGCNNANGTPKGSVEVTVNSTNPSTVSGQNKVYALQGVYGGGNLAHYNPTTTSADYPVVTINGCASSIKDVYGGGNAAAVPNTKVVVNAGDINRVFAGGNGESGAAHVGYKNKDANPSGNEYGTGKANATIKGGTIVQVFGGSNKSGVIRDNGALNIAKDGNCPMYISQVYGGGNEAPGVVGSIAIGCTGTLTGGHSTNPDGIGTTLEGIGTVYGGANAASVSGDIHLTIEDGIIQNVFGGNNQSGSISGNIIVDIEKKANPCAWYVGNVYGGGNLAAYDNSGSYPEVNIKNGTVSGDVFGGGLGATAKVRSNPVVTVGDLDHSNYVAAVTGNVYGGGSAAMVGDDDANNPSTNNTTVLIQKSNTTVAKVFGGGMEAGVTGTTGVTIADGTITDGVYGGCDNSGLVKGNITVDVTGGTIGSEDKLINSNPPVTTDVFGGGYGVSTSTAGDVTVTISKASGEGAPAAPTIYGDVYGGSAFGTVNDDANDKTTVNIMDGIIKSNPKTHNIQGTILYYTVYHGGNVYGGGLGQKQEGTPGQSGYKPAIEAKEYGEIIVNIGEPARTRDEFPPDVYNGNAVIEGNIYGCNNANGTPLDKVTVNVYKTHREATDEWDYTPASSATYALNDVFGGGNEANYLPAEAGKSVSVLIHGCYNTAERVFGGSNAAAAGSNSLNVVVNTTIDGGRYAEVYGGGNGERGSNYAADIFGNVNLAIHGGNVNQFFVGSNQHGTITGQSTVGIDNESCVSVNVDEFFCGGNYADFVGNIDAEITCSEGMSVKNLYGGCNQANVVAVEGSSTLVGNVTLTVWGGTFENVYGGSKGRADNDPQGPMSANIDGSVILNIYGGTITNAIYGGCNVKGLVKGGITVNVEDKNTADDCPLDVSTADVYGGGNLADYAPTKPNTTDYPHVNIKKATVKNVFGGGYNAKVTGNPQIKIKKGAKILGNVYGGGNMGEVDGSPKVTVNAKDESTNE